MDEMFGGFGDPTGGNHTAAICQGGDVMTWSLETEGRPRGDGCPDCGQLILYACPKCDKSIPGEYNRNTWKGGGGTPPAFCVYCRSAYPWTDARLEKMRRALRLAPEFEELSPEIRADVLSVADEIASGNLSDEETKSRFTALKRRSHALAVACYGEAKSFITDTLGVAIGTMLKP